MTKLDLNVAWDLLNSICFDGELLRPRIYSYHTLIESGSLKNVKAYLMGAYQHGYGGDRNEILIWSKQDNNDKLGTLYHEMVHQYLHEVLDVHDHGHSLIYKDVHDEGIKRLCQYINKVQASNGEATARSTKAPRLRPKQQRKDVLHTLTGTARRKAGNQREGDN